MTIKGNGFLKKSYFFYEVIRKEKIKKMKSLDESFSLKSKDFVAL